MTVPYTFATATTSIPLSQLDSNFATAITLGNTAVYLGNTTTSLGNLTLTNATISTVATTFPNSFLANSSLTIGTTNISLGGTTSSLANVTLSNVTISSGSINITNVSVSNITVTGGTIDGTAIGSTSASTGKFTTLSASTQLTLTNASNYNLYASGAGTNFMQSALGIGAITSNDVPLLVAVQGTGADINGVRVYPTIPATATGSFKAFQSIGTTAAAAFTLPNLTHYEAFQSTIGAGSAVTNQYGFYALSNLTGAANNFGFRSDIASGTNRWNFYANGTAANYFAGFSGFGTNAPSVQMHISTTDQSTSRLRLQNTGPGGTTFDIVSGQPAASNSGLGFYDATSAATRMYISSTGVISLGAAPGSESLRVTPVASAVNYWNFNGNTTGNSPFLLLNGSDTNIPALLLTKGTGNFGFYTGTTSGLTGAVQQFNVAHTASAVNYLQVTGAATTGSPVISAQGSDTNIGMQLLAKGTGSVFPRSASTTPFYVENPGYGAAFAVTQPGGTTTNANYVQVTATATAGNPSISVVGSDANIDLVLTPKGTGVLSFGTYTAGVVAQAGYITIKDAGGTTRRLLVG